MSAQNLRPMSAVAASLLLFLTGANASAAELKILLPQARTVFETNEWIDISLVRSATEALPAAPLTLKLQSTDGGAVNTVFALPAVAVRGADARATEHLHINGYLLRPGHYAIEATAHGATAKSEIDVYPHVRKSSFRVINWGHAIDKNQLVQGEDSLGFNLYYGHGSNDDAGNFIRAGVDFMANCVMSGGHQMDLRNECDWSDPYVTRGGTMRVVRRAMIDRNRPNVPGVHFYDEPGLTWDKNPETGEFGPHGIISQVRSYLAAFGRLPISYHKVDSKNPEHVAQWEHWAKWKLSLMDAAWKESQFGVSRVRSDFLSLTQSQYGFSAFTDGYYFNVVRSLPITSGHGGYHDFGPGYFNPSYFVELSRARDFWKPCWYLPTWYGNTTADEFRLEQYLSFQTNVQGMMSPPDLEPSTNASGRQGIVESNHLLQKLGTVFQTMPATKPPMAMLYSLSQAIRTQTKDMQANYMHAMPQGVNMPLTYLAGKMIQQQFLTVVEEDVLDGTLAADHKGVVLTSIDYLDPQVVAALESFAAGGGLVLLTGDCTVQIKGAVKLGVIPAMPDQKKIDEIMAVKKYDQLGPYQTTGKFLQGAAPLAQAIKAELDKAGIRPVLESSLPTIIATRQAAADIEYLFAVNATYDDSATDPRLVKNAIKAAAATISLPNDQRPVYNAVTGGNVAEFEAKGDKLTGQFRFGPGEMRVFARTARPIGGVRVATPTITRELSQEKDPIRLEIAATLTDAQGNILSGSAPLAIRVVDPLGVTRHELYRATKLGMLSLSVNLAATDPAGKWTVSVRELLNNTEGTAQFTYKNLQHAAGIAGSSRRAVSAGNDLDNAFRFARLHRDVTIVKGTSAFNTAAAERLAVTLKPWGVTCKMLDLAQASKARVISEDEARTWIGLIYAGRGQIKTGDTNPPALAGFAVDGPVILLGNPDDNPIIKFLQTEKFLPYVTDAANFPGRDRGLVAWQLDGIGRGQESITLVAYDEAGMNEAVGTFYEAVAGIDPLTRFALPQSDAIAPASSAPGLTRPATIAWSVQLPDRVTGLKLADGGLVALTHDGSVSNIAADGKRAASQVPAAAEFQQLLKDMPPVAPAAQPVIAASTRTDRMLKLSATSGNRSAIAYWGGTLRIVDAQGAIKTEQQLPQDVTALTWLGDRLIAGLADGRVLALQAD